MVQYDKTGDNHYDTISAFIKSMRGSDPDAAVYYLAKMLYAGEDIKFIARRIMICASEDVGNADPHGDSRLRSAAAQAVERIGHAGGADYPVAGGYSMWRSAPKSNSAVICAFDAAHGGCQVRGKTTVPSHLQDCPLQRGGRSWDMGYGYKYAHDYPNALCETAVSSG